MLTRQARGAFAQITKQKSFAQAATYATEKKTKLYDFHAANKGNIVPFAGWMMPLYYKDKTIIEIHKHCRENACLFDVSHMGQLTITGKDRIEFIESLVPGDVKDLAENSARLTQFTNAKGGIMDDTLVTKKADHLYVVVNAGCAEQDIAHLQANAQQWRGNGKDVQVKVIEDHSLVALQGPKAAAVLQRLIKDVDLNDIAFMTTRDAKIDGIPVRANRCGYTGEDGFEISVPHTYVETLAKNLIAQPEVLLAGLGPRDTLRLEAGLCLMGHDMNDTITPVEADLLFTISKRRRAEGGFPGADVVQKQLKEGTQKLRVGFSMEGKPIARESYKIYTEDGSTEVGIVTSGSFSPILNKGIGMGYVQTSLSAPGTKVQIDVRGKRATAVITKMPFVPSKYYRKPKKQ